MKKRAITLTINGQKHQLLVEPNELLGNVLRDRLGLTGVKYGCGTGQCGACTVLAEGDPILSCLTLAVAVDGANITTVEGLAGERGALDPLQEAFLDNNAIQCGYCTPGMIMLAKGLLNENPNPSEKEIRRHMKGNICRCTGYSGIVRAVKSCAGD
jgi:carbon-monoxide dehydrogenase small subunit